MSVMFKDLHVLHDCKIARLRLIKDYFVILPNVTK